MITLLLCADAENGLRGSFVIDHTTSTIDEAREWFVATVEGMNDDGLLEDFGWTPIAMSFPRKTLDELYRQFPFLFAP